MQGTKLDLWIPFLYKLSGWRLPIAISSDNRYLTRGRDCAYLEVITITTPWSIKFSNSRRKIMASAISVTLMSYCR